MPWALWLLLLQPQLPAAEDLEKRGEYILRAAGCSACHTDTENDGPYLAGGAAITTPFGTFFPPNITPDTRHGIGGWSEEDLARALTEGVSPSGAHYYPAFPYTSYTHMHNRDIRALKAYLDSVPAVSRPSRPHRLPWYLRSRDLVWLWNWRYFQPGGFRGDPTRSARWNRGAYIATALSHCVECHSPRDRLGGIEAGLRYAGTRDGPEGETVPNITSDRDTGIGRWSEEDLAYYFETGLAPDGDSAASLMAVVIDEGLTHLTEDDRNALAHFIHSLPPVEHQVRPRKRRRRGEFD